MALTHVLKTPIRVHSAESPPLLMGPDYESAGVEPLQVTYHKHFYALGEHYNSTAGEGLVCTYGKPSVLRVLERWLRYRPTHSNPYFFNIKENNC